MARGTTNAVGNYFLTSTTPITGQPFSVSIWIFRTNTTNGPVIWSLADGDTDNEYFDVLAHTASEDLNFRARTGGSNEQARTTGGAPASQWVNVIAVASATNRRDIWADNSTTESNTVTKVPSAVTIDRMGLGTHARLTPTAAADVNYAEYGLWDRALTADERAALAAGCAPTFFPDGLVQYIPLFRGVDGSTGNEVDRILGTTYTHTNNPTVQEHPRIFYPSSPYIIGTPITASSSSSSSRSSSSKSSSSSSKSSSSSSKSSSSSSKSSSSSSSGSSSSSRSSSSSQSSSSSRSSSSSQRQVIKDGSVLPHSTFPVTASRIFPYIYIGSGSGSKHEKGMGVEASLGGDATWALRFQLPPSLFLGVPKVQLRAISDGTGDAKVDIRWATAGDGDNPSQATLFSEGTQTITWIGSDVGKYKDLEVRLDADPYELVAGNEIILDLDFKTSGWTLDQISVWVATVSWE